MTSLFGSLDIGKKGLTTAQTGQSVSGHNISNLSTEGYSRQKLVQSSEAPSTASTHIL